MFAVAVLLVGSSGGFQSDYGAIHGEDCECLHRGLEESLEPNAVVLEQPFEMRFGKR